jgi:hypothetical protein
MPGKDKYDQLIALARDAVQIRNLMNSETVWLGPDTPAAQRFFDFLQVPEVARAWDEFNKNKPRLG